MNLILPRTIIIIHDGGASVRWSSGSLLYYVVENYHI